MSGQVHYEVFVRRTPAAPWTLQLATEHRSDAMDLGSELVTEGRVAAVRVTKEVLDLETMEFRSVTLMSQGATGTDRKKTTTETRSDPPCASPQDLYSAHARETIGRVLEDWLRRERVTPFELMHRPDLAEKLEASGMELQHAVQKIAVPEAQATGVPVHEIIRHYQKLAEQTIERVIADGRRKLFPVVTPFDVGDIARKMQNAPDRAYVLAGGVAANLASARNWREKVDRLLDLAEAAPEEVQPRALVMFVLEQPLMEIVVSRAALADLLGPTLDLGGHLAALTRISAPREVEALVAFEPAAARLMPRLTGAAERLAKRMEAGDFKLLAASIARRVLTELNGPRRLRPSDPTGEIQILRSLAMALTATGGRLLTIDEVANAFVERSKGIVSADFVDTYLEGCKGALAEAEALVRLCENVTGGANKRQAARWLSACVGALRFEKELRAAGAETATQRLGQLADLQRAVSRLDLGEREVAEISTRLGEVGGMVEADARLTAQLAKAPAPPLQKLAVLLKLAVGSGAPQGPAADRAKAEALKLVRAPETRAALVSDPERLKEMRPLLAAVGLAAA